MIAQIEQRRQLGVGFSHDVASSAAIAAIRRAAPNKLLPTKADTAAPTVAGDDVNLGFVDEIRIELLEISLPRDEDENRALSLPGVMIDDNAEIVDFLHELLPGLLSEPQEELVDHG